MTRRSFFGDLVLVTFLLAQVSDGLFTYVGIATFGARIEANPVVAWSIAVFGTGIALVTMKALAAACASLLHFRRMHRTIGVLTIVYLTCAVWPWTYALWP
jgi:arginine exporter protein ArgO